MDLRCGRVLVASVALVGLSTGVQAIGMTAQAETTGTAVGTSIPSMSTSTTTMVVRDGWPPATERLVLSPDRGPAGTEFWVKGAPCRYSDARLWLHVSSENHEMITGITTRTGSDGSWMPVRAFVPPGQAPDTYTVIARCHPNDEREVISYRGTFVVTPSRRPGRPAPARPAPAKPVKARPSFTG